MDRASRNGSFTQSKTPVINMSSSEILEEIRAYQERFGFKRPARSEDVDASRNWKHGKPDYDAADLLYFRGKSQHHPEGSLEFIVENAVKTWEMEASHLPYESWTTVDPSNYYVSTNGGPVWPGKKAAEAGNYNWLLSTCNKELYDSNNETFESSHDLFRNSFQGGFPWEVLSVFSPPPKIAFSWRHWGAFTGVYKGKQGDGKTYEMYGFGILQVNEDLKVQKIEIFYKPDDFLASMEGKLGAESLKNGKSIIGAGCPYSEAACSELFE